MSHRRGERRHERAPTSRGMQLEDLEEILAYLVEVAEDTTSQVAKLQELADKELMARFDMVTRLSRLERKVDRLDEKLDGLLDAVGAMRARSIRGWWQEYVPGNSSRTKRRRWARRRRQRNTVDGSATPPPRGPVG